MDSISENNKLAISKIKRTDFEKAKNSLKEYTKDLDMPVALKKVDSDGGLFNLFSHKVTGDELNGLTLQIQDHLVSLNGVDLELFNQIRQVYVALDALDKQYISAIIESIEAIKTVNNKTVDNQNDIQKSVENQEKTIGVLKQFKTEIENLKHIADIDSVWDLINNQSEVLLILQQNSDELSKIVHLKDVDTLWNDNSTTKEQLDNLRVLISDLDAALSERIQLLNDFKDRILHISDIDQMWEDIKIQERAINKTNDQLNDSIAVINASIAESVIRFDEAQKEITDGLKGEIINVKTDLLTELDTIQSLHREDLKSLTETAKQDKRIFVEEFESIRRTQEEAENKAELVLKETMNDFNAQIERFSNRIKIAYIVAGGAVGITIIHFVLDLVGLV